MVKSNTLIFCGGLLALVFPNVSPFIVAPRTNHRQYALSLVSQDVNMGVPTELPDSLDDAAEIAAKACAEFAEASGALGRCRVDFDTTAGDETYTLLKSSTEFTQKFVSALSYALVPGVQAQRQSEMMAVVQARAELQALLKEEDKSGSGNVEEDGGDSNLDEKTQKKESLIKILENGGRDPSKPVWEGPIVRIFFPDEGSAALARRDWNPQGPPEEAKVPPCVQFSSCGGVQRSDVKNDVVVVFCCPKASEADDVEKLLQYSEEKSENLKLTIFINPNLVDMGVTGFGMAGRMLRERLIDPLVNVYYLRTLQWGALTRVWPKAFSVWQEDEDAEGGYRLINTSNRLPSNPEVEDIYDMENSGGDGERKGGGPLDQLGDFVNGMMRL